MKDKNVIHMGQIQYPKQKTKHDVRVVDPTPVWVGVDSRSPATHYFMQAHIADAWLKEAPEYRSVKLKTTAGALRQHKQREMGTSIWET